MRRSTKIITLLLSSFLLTGCGKGFAEPIGTPGVAVNPAHVFFYAHVGDTVAHSHEDVTPGKPVSEPSDPTPQGEETFWGWSLKEHATTEEDIWKFSDSIPLHTEGTKISYFGQWTLPSKVVTVSFFKTEEDYNNFTTYHQVDVNENESIPTDKLPQNPSIQGKTFLGWYKAGDTTKTVVDLVTYKASYAASNFIGKWDGEGPTPTTEYKVTYYVDGSVYEEKTGLHTGDLVPAPSKGDPSKSGYTFKGWSTNGSESGIVDISTQRVGTSNLSYYAVFVGSTPETWTFYFEMKPWWQDANAVTRMHLWNNDGKTTDWPGLGLTYVADGDDNKKYYSLEIDNAYTTAILSRWDPANTSFTGDPWNKIDNIDLTARTGNCLWADVNDGVITFGWFTYTPAV